MNPKVDLHLERGKHFANSPLVEGAPLLEVTKNALCSE